MLNKTLAHYCLALLATTSIASQALERTSTITVQSDTNKTATRQEAQIKTMPLSWRHVLTEIPTQFAQSLFAPFMQDAPKVWQSVKSQKDILSQNGLSEYALDKAHSLADVIVKNPLDTLILGGAASLSWTNIADYNAMWPITVVAANSVKNAKMLYQLANSLQTKSFVSKGLQLGLYGSALYAASALPLGYALQTPVIGAPFQLNESDNFYSNYIATDCTQDRCMTIWTNGNSNQIVGSISFANGTLVAREFDVSVNPISLQITPTMAALEQNFAVTWSVNNSQIVARIFNPNASPVTPLFQVNQNSYAEINTPQITELSNGNTAIIWGGGTPSQNNYNLLGRIFNSLGTAQTNEFTIIHSSSATDIESQTLTGLSTGDALVTYGVGAGSLGGSSSKSWNSVLVSPTGNVSTPLVLQANTSNSDFPVLTPFLNGFAMIAYSPEGTEIITQTVQNNGTLYESPYAIRTGNIQVYFPAIASSSTNNALVGYAYNNQQTGDHQLLCDLISSNNLKESDEFQVTPEGSTYSIGALPNDNYLVTWMGQNTQVMASHISFVNNGTNAVTATPTSSSPAAITSGFSALISPSVSSMVGNATYGSESESASVTPGLTPSATTAGSGSMTNWLRYFRA